jgi:ectoine hydroxylase-related dioxygenase (phytanoyl-CoA dioxygenase family)
MFQDMALVKPPFIGSEKPWHQDNAYFSVTPLDSVLGVWIALDEATAANGCMHVLRGGHQLGALRHFHGRDCEIMPQRVDESQALAVPLPPGGAMFFYGMLPHQTPPNSSPDRRRALQFHYRSASSQVVPRDEYDRIYAEADGTPASCAAAADHL